MARQLLRPYKMGSFDLFRQVVLALMSWCRSYGSLPQPEAGLYYSQRATTGGLLISEGTAISPDSLGYEQIPGIWTQEQVEAWGPIVDAVHHKEALFFSQIAHVGRVYTAGIQKDGHTPISSTDKAITPDVEAGIVYAKPRALHMDEMPCVVDDFRRAARNAREAGFDGVEIHAAHGFLLEQFMKDSVNDRTDMYGGSLENRCRIVMEVVDAIVREVAAHRVGIRLSPFLDHMDCVDSDPEALAAYLLEQLNKHQGFLYCRMVQTHMAIVDGHKQIPHGILSFKKVFNGTFIAFDGYDKEDGNKVVSEGYARRVPPRPAAGMARWLEPTLLEVPPLQAVPPSSTPPPSRNRPATQDPSSSCWGPSFWGWLSGADSSSITLPVPWEGAEEKLIRWMNSSLRRRSSYWRSKLQPTLKREPARRRSGRAVQDRNGDGDRQSLKKMQHTEYDDGD